MLDHAANSFHSERAQITDRLLDAAGISVDRLPMLPVLFDRMARVFADAMRQKSASPSYISVSDIGNERIGDVLDVYESNALVAVLYSPEWDTRLLIGFDRDFIFTMIDVLFGADGTEPPIDEERTFSSIETRIARTVFEVAANALQESFSPIAETTLKIERVESRMDFAIIGRRNNPAVVARLLLQAIGRGGEIFVVMPHSTLNPLRQRLSQVLSGEMAGRDKQWTQHFQAEIQRTEVKLQAVLEERELTLGEIANLKIGQIIELQATPRSPVKLECNQQPIFNCRLGQLDGSYTLQVEDLIHLEKDIVDDLLSR
ncbi:flagellar motor switch protein FliM [Pannonibacter sp. Q-1]|uniref:Flagellar motor switch protein FliM n=3 Tax=Pannonibacter TaxID=227873 RepID=A0A0L0IVZ8_9HYPH|nr:MULTISPECIES: FliM/FliN family flagellar motor switch protein [Pannonibacter]ALV26321.1 flagellar motor switch protein FliM [Pannonibacter phragmitetus]KND17469.1 flagellar motor switch protein FliM [Pannonibacter phragmitetus]MBA4205129.1 flagellar motor switch protein FliM [Polymorphum sp.]CUB01146.1 Flagellar motor switch protein FliM [Pannonibacter indicus]